MSVEPMMERASEYFRTGDFVRSEALYSGVLQVQSDNVKALSNRSAAFMKLGDFNRALADAQRCTRVDPSFVKGWGRLGAALHTLKHYEDAAKAYEHAIRLDPHNSGYQESLREVKALVLEGRGVATDEGRADYYFRRSVDAGVQAMKDNKFDEAVRHFSKAMSQSPACDSEMHVLLANRSAANMKLGKTLEALDDAMECVALRPDYSRGHVRLAAAAIVRGDLPSATEAVEHALRLDPNNPTAKEVEAQVKVATEKWRSSEEARKAKERSDREALARAASQVGDIDASAPANRVPTPQTSSFAPTTNRHTVSYARCRICSENGHTAKDCPLRARPM